MNWVNANGAWGLKGYIGLTDPEWYDFLSNQSSIDEVNFWQPRANREFRAIERESLFFFKLRAPRKAIAGFAFFQRYESLPAWLAWECFGKMNGAESPEKMLDMILGIRGDESAALRSGDFPIGCILLAAPIFFKDNEWIDPPTDWAKTGIQRGKTYDLDHGEGKRIFEECLERAEGRYWNVDRIAASDPIGGSRFGPPYMIKPRLGQGLFSIEVRKAYDNACAITNEHSTPVLDAAHIRPYSIGGEHKVSNGLLLRRDLHRLFDLGYVTITPDYLFKVGDRLRNDYRNGRTYYQLDKAPIHIPDAKELQPNRELLEWHGTAVFKK